MEKKEQGFSMNNLVEIDYQFTDITMIESDGSYEKCLDIFKKEDILVEKWVISSILEIYWSTSPKAPMQDSGYCNSNIEFHNDKNVFLLSFEGSGPLMGFSRDLETLSNFLVSKGWNRIEPHPDLVKENINFWKHYWDTMIINSKYLDDRFETREKNEYSDNI